MRHVATIIAGIVWGIVALLTYACLGMDADDLWQISASTFGCAIATAHIVVWTFRGVWSSPRASRNRALPFATIAVGVAVWLVMTFSVAAISSLIRGRPDVFDGFFYAFPVTIVAMLTVALPVTYPLAYATQRFIGWSFGPASPDDTRQ